MAKKRDEAVIDLVIQGRSAESTFKAIQKASFDTEKMLRNMSKAANPEEYAKLVKEAHLLKQALASMNGEIHGTTQSLKNQSSQLRSTQNDWQKFAENPRGIIAGVVGGNMITKVIQMSIDAMIALVSNSKKAFQEFDTASAELQSATLMSKDTLDELKRSARELDGEMGYTAQEYLKAATKIGSAKSELTGSAEAMDEMVQKAMLFAKAGKLELPVAAEALAKMLNQFGEGAGEAGIFVDILAKGFALGAAELPQMVEAMKYAGVAANQFNVTFGETNSALQLLVKNGMTGEMAGTQLRNILLELGSGADNTNPKIVGFEKAIENLGKKHLSTAEQVKMFGKENYAGIQILLNNQDVLHDWIDAIDEKGAAEKMAAINMNTLEEAEKSFGATTNDLFVLIGEKLAAAFKSLYEWGGRLIHTFKEIVESSDGTIEAMAGIFGAIGDLLGGIRDLILTFTGYNRLGQIVVDITKVIGFSLKVVASIFMAVTNEVVALVGAFNVLINSGYKVMNFFGGKFRIDPFANFKNVADKRQQGIDKVGSLWNEPVTPQKSTKANSPKIDFRSREAELQKKLLEADKNSGNGSDKNSKKKEVDEFRQLKEEIKKLREDAQLDMLDKNEREVQVVKFKYERLRELAKGNKD